MDMEATANRPEEVTEMETITVPEVITDLTTKLEGCTVRWESTGGGCYGVVVAADVRWTPRRWVYITEPDETYRTSDIPDHPWGTNGYDEPNPRFAVAYFDHDDDQAPCQPQIGWEQHDDADRLAADAARWLMDAEMPAPATKF